jgi:hypothetical protein
MGDILSGAGPRDESKHPEKEKLLGPLFSGNNHNGKAWEEIFSNWSVPQSSILNPQSSIRCLLSVLPIAMLTVDPHHRP